MTDGTGRSGRGRKGAGVGDVVAVPASDGGYHFGVLLGEGAFGTAIGFVRGTFAAADWPPAEGAPEVRRHAVHTDKEAVRSGDWSVVAHDPALAARFPEPEIYHAAGADDDLLDLLADSDAPEVGGSGMGEAADGTTRQLDEAEAREIGLLDGSYEQTVLSEYVPAHLARLGL
ncbi:hypothetical protein DY218_14170 [Streptomyces triticagri]|uniref:Uncharacterized protein n=1 Tax=Streptomyces triticagri TaxID=2293568 RepID=A0A372M5F5_9ACTN|nr:hypothetical protein [Streptomyces triticagri]RFU86049.1 hypothetical protein DY218_14170 [Streptomyces triticagri]